MGDGMCSALWIKEETGPPCPGPDFLSSNMRWYHLVVKIKNFSGITKQLNFISAELKKSYIYLHCSKNNELFFFLHIFINTSQPNRDVGIGHEVTPGGTAGGTAGGAGTAGGGGVRSLAHRPRHHCSHPDGGKPPHQSTISTREDALKHKFSPPPPPS